MSDDNYCLGLVLPNKNDDEENRHIAQVTAHNMWAILRPSHPVGLENPDGILDTLPIRHIIHATDITPAKNPTIWIGLGPQGANNWSTSKLLEFASGALGSLRSLNVVRENLDTIQLLLIRVPTSKGEEYMKPAVDCLEISKIKEEINEGLQFTIPNWNTRLTLYANPQYMKERLMLESIADASTVDENINWLIHTMMHILNALCKKLELPPGKKQVLERMRLNYLLS